MNAVNFTDGVDGLAAGVCAISAAAFASIAFDLGRDGAGVLALITCGAALGFLVHNFHPASVFMGDCGANLLGLLLGAMIVEGSLKTNAVIALIVPLVVLAVPFLDTTFVVLKRMKYRRPVYRGRRQPLPPPLRAASASRSGGRCSTCTRGPRRWRRSPSRCASCPYSDDRGHFDLGLDRRDGRLPRLLALAASVYLVYMLEILKFAALRACSCAGRIPAPRSTRSTPRSSTTSRRASSRLCSSRRRAGVAKLSGADLTARSWRL